MIITQLHGLPGPCPRHYFRLLHLRQRYFGGLHNRLIALLLLSVGVSILTSVQSQAANNNDTLLILGDSLSAGYGVPLAKSWVTLLQQRLQQRLQQAPAEATAVSVVNASVSGETTLGGRQRLAALLTQHQPRWLLLELGANDGLRGLPIADIQANLQAMISLAQSRGVIVILIGMRLPPNYGTTYTAAFADLFPTLAKRYQCASLPFLLEGIANNLDKMQADGLHPNVESQMQLLENVWPVLQPVLAVKPVAAKPALDQAVR